MNRIEILWAACIFALAGIFSCTESPSSPPTDGSSSSGVSSSSSVGTDGFSGRACEYRGELFGLGNGLLFCGEKLGDAPVSQEDKDECEEEGGTWVNTCPSSGKKATCIDEEDEEEGVIYFYTDEFACSDFGLKRADGSEDNVPKGGACGPFEPYPGVALSMCAEFPELSTGVVKIGCAELYAPFASKCPGDADLNCYNSEEKAILHLYSAEELPLTCEDMNMEEYNIEPLRKLLQRRRL